LAWTIHPAAQRPGEAVGVALVVALAAALAARLTGSWTAGILAAVLLGASLRAYFLPCRFELDRRGARARGALLGDRALAWEAVRRVVRERHGVHLSTVHSPSRLVRDRGLFLRTAGNRDAVAAFASRRVEGA